MQCRTPALSMLEIAICDAESGRTPTTNTLSSRCPEFIIRMTTIRFNSQQLYRQAVQRQQKRCPAFAVGRHPVRCRIALEPVMNSNRNGGQPYEASGC